MKNLLLVLVLTVSTTCAATIDTPRLLAGSEVLTTYQSGVNFNDGQFGVRVNKPIVVQFTAKLGTEPYSYSLTMGSLPPGLAMSAGGLVTGTPSAVGTYQITLYCQGATRIFKFIVS